tara:strand:- start:808 stop:954 length:147 start_codon:yes stop_codon:yes gene_type:complete
MEGFERILVLSGEGIWGNPSSANIEGKANVNKRKQEQPKKHIYIYIYI